MLEASDYQASVVDFERTRLPAVRACSRRRRAWGDTGSRGVKGGAANVPTLVIFTVARPLESLASRLRSVRMGDIG